MTQRTFTIAPVSTRKPAFARGMACVALAVSISSLPACVNPTNPYDVESPDALQARASIRGDIRANVDTNGDQPPIEGATVVITLSDGSDVDDVTDADGAFVLAGLAPGFAHIAVTHPDFQSYSADMAPFAPGEERNAGPLFLSPFTADGEDLAIVTGTVLKEGEESDHSGIVLRDADDPTFFGVTRQDGSVEFRVAPGPRELVVDEFGFEQATIEVVASVDAQTDFGSVTLPFVPGEVFGVASVEDPAVAQSISISLDRGGVDQVLAGGDGSYRLPVVPAGIYRLTAFADGHDAVEVGSVTVIPNEETEVPPVFLSRSRGAISGTARYAPGFDADNSGIVVSVAGTSAIGTTDNEGAFLIENAPTNVDTGYTLSFRADDFLTQTVAGVLVNKNAATVLADTVVLAKQIGDFEIIPSPYTNTADVMLRLAPIPQGALQVRISEDSAFIGADYEAFPVDGDGNIETDLAYTITGDDGQVTLYVQYLLDDASEAGPFSSSVVLDRIAPVVDAVTLDDGTGVTNATNTVVHVDATDATVPTRYEVSELEAFDNPAAIVGNPYGVSTRIDFADAVNDGPRTIFVRVFDAAGNISETASATVVRDTTPPPLAAFSLDCQGVVDAPICGDTSVGLTIDAPEASEWFVSLAPGAQPSETDWNSFQDALVFSGLGLAQGERTLYLLLRDAAGNVSDVFSDSIVIDTAAPSAASVLIDSGAPFIENGRTTAQLTLFALGAAQMRISADADTTDDPEVAYAPTSTVTLPAPLVEGPLTYYVTFIDAAGNQVTVSDSVTVDTSAPTPGPLPITIDGQADFTASLSVTLSLDAVDAAEMRLSVDDTATVAPPTVSDWIPFAATSLALLPAGDCGAADGACKLVCARFRDEAGNETAADVCASIVLDSTPPAPAIVSSAPDVTDQRTATLVLAEQPADANFNTYEILVTPGGVGFVTVDASPTAPPTFTINLPDMGGEVAPAYLNKTEYLVRIRAVDDGGNVGPEATHRIVYDEWDPAAPSIASASVTLNADTFALLLDASNNAADDDATFTNYEVAQIFCSGFQRTACETAGDPAVFTPSAQTDGLLFTLNQGLAAGCIAPCANRLFIRAVDEAGNVGPTASVIIDEDSQSPTKPKMLPKFASTYGDRAVMRLAAEATDATAVTYQVRGGLFDNYVNYPATAGGIFSVPLLRNDVNEICVRAQDEAGNVSVEECSVVTQEDQITVATEDDIEFMHLEDNYLSILANRDLMQIRDLRTDATLSVGGPLFHDTSAFAGVAPPMEILHGSIAVTDGALDIGFIATSLAPNGTFYRWVGYKSVPLTSPSLFPQPGQECSYPGEFEQRCQFGYFQDLDSIPLMFDLDEDSRVFVGSGYILMRRTQLANPGLGTPERVSLDAELVASTAPPTTADVALRAMDPGADLCRGTDVEITRMSPTDTTFVWCESDDNATGRVYRRTVQATDTGGGIFTFNVGELEQLGTTTIELADLFDGANRFNQPVMTATDTYWLQNGELRGLDHGAAPGTDANVDPSLDDTIKRLAKTVGGDRLSMIRFSGAPGASPAYVYTYDLDPANATPLRQITNGLVTPYEAVVDGPRVMWIDRATLRSAVYYLSLGELEWQAHGPQITAFPSTDGAFTTFIDGRDSTIGFYAFNNVEGIEYPVTDEFALEGLNEGGQTQANGTAVWVRRVEGAPTRYQVMTSNLANILPSGFPESCPLTLVPGANAAEPPEVMAIDDTGNIIAFAQGTQIYISHRIGPCEWDPTSVLDDINGPRAGDIDVVDMGDPMVVWSVRFEAQRDEVFYRHGNRSGQIAGESDQGFLGFYPRTVELARDGGRVVFAAEFFSENVEIPPGEPIPAASEGAVFCTVAETGATFCAGAKKTAVSANVFGGQLDRLSLAENGLLIATESGIGFAGISHLLVIDTRTGRQRTLLPAFLGDFAANDANAGYDPTLVDGNPQVSFSSIKLGSVDVWTAEILR